MSPWGRGFDDCARYWKGKKKGHGEDLEGVMAGLSAFRFPIEIDGNRKDSWPRLLSSINQLERNMPSRPARDAGLTLVTERGRGG